MHRGVEADKVADVSKKYLIKMQFNPLFKYLALTLLLTMGRA